MHHDRRNLTGVIARHRGALTGAKWEEGKKVQWNLDLSFFKGMEKQNNECGKTISPGNYYTL